MDTITYSKIRNGYFVTAADNHRTGSVKGDLLTGFWAYTIDGRRLYTAFPSVRDAAEVLALEYAIEYGTGCSSTVYAEAGTSS